MTRVLELLVSLLIVTVLVVVVGVLLPSHGHVERSVEVSSPVRQIFDSVNTLRRFPEWSPERRLDPQLHMEFSGTRIGKGAKLVRREYPTAIGPVDIMAVNAEGEHVAVEIKRHGGIDGVEQLTRYCELLNRDPLLAPVHGIFAAQTITPQAQVLAKDRGFTCLILDYDDRKGTEDDSLRLF